MDEESAVSQTYEKLFEEVKDAVGSGPSEAAKMKIQVKITQELIEAIRHLEDSIGHLSKTISEKSS